MMYMWGDKTLEQAVKDGDLVIYDVNVDPETNYNENS